MRKLALAPLLVFALACNDSGVVQPDDDLAISAAAAPRVLATSVCTFVGTSVPWDVRITPSGVIHQSGGVNDFDCVGELAGMQYVTGAGHIDTKTGKGTFRGSLVQEVTSYFGQPVTGAFECGWHSLIVGFPDFVQTGKFFACKGSGYFEGMKAKAEGGNAAGEPAVNYWEIR